jgi:hypothetical protein
LVASSGGTTIASQHPGDVGIENHPNVVFVERFDDSVSNVSTRWTETANSGNLSLTTDFPSGSPGGTSLRISGGGGHLYKNLAASSMAINDTAYLRYYVKYPTGSNAQHSGIWMGGYNPALNWPNPMAGIRPQGNDRFSAAAEDALFDVHNFDHYNYWMGMRQSGDGNYWGNVLLSDPSVKTPLGQWTCVEQMIKLNNPVTSLNGEHAIWLNDVKVSHLGQGFPNGFWNGGRFTQDPSGQPFEGFQWRNTSALNVNWIWLQNYVPSSPFTELEFDHVVLATSRVGCLSSGSTLIGDLNSDGTVNGLDWSMMNAVWFTNDANADLNDDGLVNSIDYGMLNANWGMSS